MIALYYALIKQDCMINALYKHKQDLRNTTLLHALEGCQEPECDITGIQAPTHKGNVSSAHMDGVPLQP